MKFSEAWLREWVNPSIDTDALVQQLTMAGLEVDGIEPAADAFGGVVVGRVVTVDKHPNAEKLSVCQVSDGETEHQVVCGAPNVRPGLVTAFARIGAKLPKDFKIKKAKLRQVESFGMLCSAAELGVGDDADGIMDLPETLPLGADLRQALDLDDQCIEVDLTPNRGDCLSLRGLAREVGVLNRVAVTSVSIPAVVPTIDAVVPVSLPVPEACPRYLGRVIKGVDVSRPSPLWLTERLRRSGLRSIDPIVDVTNYVLLELGQPLHAFDLAKLKGGVEVRFARAKEPLELLDGKVVTLDEKTLVIADESGAVAMAGVMGGAASAVSDKTVDVFLECAYFNPLAVAGTARRYGLHTDAGHRYERGVDSALQADAIERATALLIELAGGQPGSVFTAVVPEALPSALEVQLREARLARVAGFSIAAATVDDILQRLDFDVLERAEESSGVTWRVRVPSHRFDVSIEADLIEEVCRIYGYNQLPTRRPHTDLTLARVPQEVTSTAALKRQLAAMGYQEVVTYSFIEPKQQQRFDPELAPQVLANPMSVEQSVMRTSLLPGLLDVWVANRARQQADMKIFELGQCFLPGDTLQQRLTVGGLLTGARAAEGWLRQAGGEPVPGAGVKAGALDFFDLKGDLEQLLGWQGVDALRFEAMADDPALHPGQAARLFADTVAVGRFGRLHPALESDLDLGQAVFVFELDAARLLKREAPRYQAVSRFPAVRRDLALLVDRDLPAMAIKDTVVNVLGERLVDFTIFDVYIGKGIENTKKSVAIGLTIQDASATLTDDQITEFEGAVIAALKAELNAELR